MNTPERWEATVNSDGDFEGDPRPYTGPNDDGGGVSFHANGVTFYTGIGPTPEAAKAFAMREYELAEVVIEVPVREHVPVPRLALERACRPRGVGGGWRAP